MKVFKENEEKKKLYEQKRFLELEKLKNEKIEKLKIKIIKL